MYAPVSARLALDERWLTLTGRILGECLFRVRILEWGSKSLHLNARRAVSDTQRAHWCKFHDTQQQRRYRGYSRDKGKNSSPDGVLHFILKSM